MDECQCLGDYLRQQRQGKGLSLKDIALRTKVTQAYLQALEDGHYERLPAETYLKGFLVSYADSLGLSSKKILALYHSERTEQMSSVAEFQESSKYNAVTFKRSRRNPIIIILLAFFVFAGAGIWWFTSNGQTSAADDVRSDHTGMVATVKVPPVPGAPPAETVMPSGKDPVVQEKEPVAGAADQPHETSLVEIESSTIVETSLEGPIRQDGPTIELPAVMELKATGSVAVAVTIDGRDVQSYDLHTGSLLRWRIGETVDLILDPPTAAQVRFGDVVVSPDESGRFVLSKREN